MTYQQERSHDKWAAFSQRAVDPQRNSMLLCQLLTGVSRAVALLTADGRGEPRRANTRRFPCVPGGNRVPRLLRPTTRNDDFEFEDEEVDAF